MNVKWYLIYIILKSHNNYLKLRPIEIPMFYEGMKEDQLRNTSRLYNARISNNLNFKKESYVFLNHDYRICSNITFDLYSFVTLLWVPLIM